MRWGSLFADADAGPISNAMAAVTASRTAPTLGGTIIDRRLRWPALGRNLIISSSGPLCFMLCKAESAPSRRFLQTVGGQRRGQGELVVPAGAVACLLPRLL